MNELQSPAINELAAALCKAQGEIKSAKEDKTNPHFKSSYASLDSVWEACRDPLTKHGLSVVQLPNVEGEMLILTTMLMHTSGQWIKSRMPITSAKMTPQAIGSGMTYMRRYCLASLVGVAPKDWDDDGNEAQSTSGKNFTPVKYEVSTEKEALPSLKDVEVFKNKFPDLDPALVDRYLDVLADKTKNTKEAMVGIAMKNESYFLTQFTKWRESFPKEKVG
jgi:hypothetical protein